MDITLIEVFLMFTRSAITAFFSKSGLGKSTHISVFFALAVYISPASALTIDDCRLFATGGDISVINTNGMNYCLHRFTGDGSFTALRNLEVEYLVVGGGGGGGPRHGGGGGAGQFIQGSFPELTIGSYPVVIGSGGVERSHGNPSSVFGLTAKGGNPGLGAFPSTLTVDPASGGGGRNSNDGPTPSNSSAGNPGGRGHTGSTWPSWSGGGGGGAQTSGGNASQNAAGDGGSGSSSSITGELLWYAGGGGGGTEALPAGAGGQGGGGNGGRAAPGQNAFVNSGGGGGGGGYLGGSTFNGGNGGSGVVIVRYQPVVPSGDDAVSEIPDTPLVVPGASVSPMVMLTMSRDHTLYYAAYNDASDLTGDGVVNLRYSPEDIDYYGYFDSFMCYRYINNRFEPVSKTPSKKCTSHWSGDFLNYITMSRIDTLRKVLYGGKRSTDTDGLTVLERSYTPQDAHSWGKEYRSIARDGYDIRDYSPLGLPSSGRYHLFANTSLTSDPNNPRMRVLQNTNFRVWEWVARESPVAGDRCGSGASCGSIQNYSVRVVACRDGFLESNCKRYPSGHYKPTGLLQEFGDNDRMLFGLLTGSYLRNMSGGVLRAPLGLSFDTEINPDTGRFSPESKIINTIEQFKIVDFSPWSYRGGWYVSGAMTQGRFPDWGNPLGEMLYETIRYFAGKKAPTPAFIPCTGNCTENVTARLGASLALPVSTWNDPFEDRPYCSAAATILLSDIYPSFDSDSMPGSPFSAFSGDLPSFNMSTLGNDLWQKEYGSAGLRFIGQVGNFFDGVPSVKQVNSLGNIRGLSPAEPTKQGSFSTAVAAKYAFENDIRPDIVENEVNLQTFSVALPSPLPEISIPIGDRLVTLVPFAKSVNNFGISPQPNRYQPTNTIVAFFIEAFANIDPDGLDRDLNVNGGLPFIAFRVNFEDVEQGADHDMDAIARYEIRALANGQLRINMQSEYASGSIEQHMGFVISGTTNDGVYLEIRDCDTANPSALGGCNNGGNNPGVVTRYYLDTPPGFLPNQCARQTCPALPLSSTRTFSLSTTGQTARLLNNPLWYAAKYGSDGNENLSTGEPSPNYFLATNAGLLEEQLREALEKIADISSSGGEIAVTSDKIKPDGSTFAFATKFDSKDWSGDLLAYRITETGVEDNPVWNASSVLPRAAQRKIYMGETSVLGQTPVEFRRANFTPEQLAILDGFKSYLRGNDSEEIKNGGTFRNREHALGAIVNSAPNFSEELSTVFVGSSSGYIHAFDAETGIERFAFLPSAVDLEALRTLADPNYKHRFAVDGQTIVTTKSQTDEKNILVGALGRGGVGLYALDVTNPDQPKYLWEVTADDPNMGKILAEFELVTLTNGTPAIVTGNGYESESGVASIYIFNALTGELIRQLSATGSVWNKNAMSSPTVFIDAENDAIHVYAGDIQGNVWKFDISNAEPSFWSVAYGSSSAPLPLFVARDSAGKRQPITAPVTVAVNQTTQFANTGKRFVWFGTGSYIKQNDPSNKDIQTWYGIIDDGNPVSRNQLNAGGISQTGASEGFQVRSFNRVNNADVENKKGWYIDFDTPNGSGERIVTRSNLYFLAEPVLIASSIIPSDDPCEFGGSGYINLINPFTGGNVTSPIFKVGDNFLAVDEGFGEENPYAGSVQLNVGMPGEAVIVGDQLIASGSSGSGPDFIKVNLGGDPENRRVLWTEMIR